MLCYPVSLKFEEGCGSVFIPEGFFIPSNILYPNVEIVKALIGVTVNEDIPLRKFIIDILLVLFYNWFNGYFDQSLMGIA